MRKLFQKPWFSGILILGLMLITILLNVWIMSLRLTSIYANENFWSLAQDVSTQSFASIYGFTFTILFYISILTFLLSGFSFIRKSNWGFNLGILFVLGFEITLIVFQSIFNYLSVMALILVILNMVLVVGMFVILIMRKKVLNFEKLMTNDEENQRLHQTKIPLFVLLIDIMAIVFFFTTFFIPFYSLIQGSMIEYHILINVLLLGETSIIDIIYFLSNFALFVGAVLYFANCLSSYFYDKEKFIYKSKTLIKYTAFTSLMFFLMGLIMTIIYTLSGSQAQTFAFIPMILMIIVIFSFSIFQGKFDTYNQTVYEDEKIGYAKSEPVFYVIILTAITALMILLPIIKIHISASGYTHDLNLTGIDILRDYAVLDPGYRIVAYILVVMLISSGISLIVTIASYLAKYKQFNDVVKMAAGVNVFFVFMVGISGYYFQIAQIINQALIIDIFNYYGISVPILSDAEFSISTDAIYALIASVSMLTLMIMRKSFDRDILNILEGSQIEVSDENGSGGTGSSSQTIDDESYFNFDPSPAFTDLDSQIDFFTADLEQRNTLKLEQETSLGDLVNFVVDYAKNSRLHLSYTPEDIATFVAGLGASKLSILQGMSGTGKTSLPKIFSEAILGNCEIVEVESSWKDKNELLGYYNEFSMKYTPKKFTLSLYKAALNKDIFTFILLDEMNLSRIEYYFSDFLSLMENEKDQRSIRLTNIKLIRRVEGEEQGYHVLENDNTLHVPPNVWFIGTANRDESTFVISDKVYDRAHTMNFTKRAPKVRNYSDPIPQRYYDYETINHLLNTAIQAGDFDAENNHIIKSVEQLLAPFNISFGNRILKQIEDFVNVYKACFTHENVEDEAVEKILFSKVVAKLEVKTIDNKEKLERDFIDLKLHQCAAFVKSLDID